MAITVEMSATGVVSLCPAATSCSRSRVLSSARTKGLVPPAARLLTPTFGAFDAGFDQVTRPIREGGRHAERDADARPLELVVLSRSHGRPNMPIASWQRGHAGASGRSLHGSSRRGATRPSSRRPVGAIPAEEHGLSIRRLGVWLRQRVWKRRRRLIGARVRRDGDRWARLDVDLGFRLGFHVSSMP